MLSPYIAPYILVPGNSLATGLEALYVFAERTGTVLHDFSGHNRVVSIPAGHWLTGPNLGAINLNGAYSIGVPLPNLPKYPMTMAVAATMPAASNTAIVSLADITGHNFTTIRNDFGTDVDATLDDAAMGFQTSSRLAVTADTWHTYVMVIEATRLTLYLDGVVVGVPTTLPAPPSGLVTDFILGGASGTAMSITTMSVAALASRAWSAAEAAAFAAGPTSMVTAAVINAVFAQLFRRRH